MRDHQARSPQELAAMVEVDSDTISSAEGDEIVQKLLAVESYDEVSANVTFEALANRFNWKNDE